MARNPRYVPPDSLVEVTTRTVQSRFLLRPSRDLNEIIIGILARAKRYSGVRICAFVWLSNHHHMLINADDAKQLADFMAYVNGNTAKEANRLHSWSHHFWARRYEPVLVSDEPEAQEARLRYIFRNGCKEGLVAKPAQWPGVHCVEALLTGRPMTGLWYNRTAERDERAKGKKPEKYQFANQEILELDVLPCWRGLSQGEVRERVAAMIQVIEEETRASHLQNGTTPMGVKKILQQDPHDSPAQTKTSPSPRFHTHRPEVRKALQAAFRMFLDAYRQAATELRSGNRNAQFPVGSFPPGLPFVRGHPEFAFR